MQFPPIRKWNILIQSSTRDGFFSESLELYSSLVKHGLHGNHLTIPLVLKACAQLSSLLSGRKIHSHSILLGLDYDVFVQTSLVDMYSKCSSLSEARKLFNEMPTRSVVSWNSIISAYAKELYTDESCLLFNQMRSCGFVPTSSTCISLISGCSRSTSVLQRGLLVHSYGIKVGFHSDLRLWNSILCIYVQFNLINDALTLFYSMKERSAFSYATIISGYANLGDCFKVFNLFNEMRSRQICLDAVVFICLVSSCAMLDKFLISSSVVSLLIRSGLNCKPGVAASVVNMYAKCGDIISAWKVFDSAIEKDVLLWTSMIGGYVRAGLSVKALDLFNDMVTAGFLPNKVTLLTMLSACASISSLSIGEHILKHINAHGLSSDLQIQTSLIHMYCKCGSLERAQQIFDAIPCKDLAASSSMINCYASHGKGHEALALFKDMLKDISIVPDAAVFTNVLSACCHCGLVEEGLECFNIMQRDFGIESCIEHYSCMVDLLSRAGYFNLALDFIHRAPIELRCQLWTPFFSALRDDNSVHHSNIMCKKLLEVGIESTMNHELLASIAACLGKWKEAGNFRISMDKRELRKEAGWSRIELYV